MVIYKITNVINNKVYIGQTIKTFERRIGQHLSGLRKGTHRNPYLQQSFAKHGESAFKFDILEQFDPEMNFDLDNLERYWIKFYDSMNRLSGYNLTSGGNLGRQNAKVWNKGKKLTSEHRNKLMRAKAGKDYSHISRANAKKVTVRAKNVHTNQEFVFQTMKECASYLGVSPSGVRCHIVRGTKLINKTWKIFPIT